MSCDGIALSSFESKDRHGETANGSIGGDVFAFALSTYKALLEVH